MKEKRKYISPKLIVEEIFFEDDLANGSILIKPGNEFGNIIIEDWSPTINVDAPEEGTQW